MSVAKCFLFLLCVISFNVYSVDIVRMNTGNLPNDVRVEYRMQILTMALEASQHQYGPYKIQIIELPTTAKRALLEVHSGRTINLFIGVTTREWEEKNLPIRIPIRRGILNYRLLAVNSANIEKFDSIINLEALKKQSSGLRVGWATTDIFKSQGFNYYELESLDGLYKMLESNAIDYVPRGINEIYGEIAVRGLKNVVVHPKLTLNLIAPTYIIVSPNEVRLANRIEFGLEKMIEDGSLKSTFYQFYADKLAQTDLSNKQVITINNPDLPKNIPLDRKELWFVYD